MEKMWKLSINFKEIFLFFYAEELLNIDKSIVSLEIKNKKNQNKIDNKLILIRVAKYMFVTWIIK